jgi:hypothetical protein
VHTTLPLQSSVDEIKTEARQLFSDLRRRDVAAIARCHSLDPQVDPFEVRLGDVQYILARHYGCKSWRKLLERFDRIRDDSPTTTPFLVSSIFTPM